MAPAAGLRCRHGAASLTVTVTVTLRVDSEPPTPRLSGAVRRAERPGCHRTRSMRARPGGGSDRVNSVNPPSLTETASMSHDVPVTRWDSACRRLASAPVVRVSHGHGLTP